MSVNKLRVYQQSLKAFQLIEVIAEQLPKELYDTKRQILRSSKAIAPLLAEGYGRKSSQKEFKRFGIEAMSTSDETVTHLRTIALSKYNTIQINQLKQTAEVYKSISRQLNKLVCKLKENI